MARIRSTHPEQWTDERFVTCSPLARLLALALRNEADDGGVFQWRPVQLKIRLMPADNCDVSELLAELEAAHVVRRYEINGSSYGAIRNFKRFQSPKKPREVHPRTEWVEEYVTTGGCPVPHQFPTDTEQVRGEGKGKEGKGGESGSEPEPPPPPNLPHGKRVTSIDALTLEEGEHSLARELRVDATNELAKFKDNCRAKGRVFKDYRSAFRNWLRNEAKWRDERRPNGSLPLRPPDSRDVPRQTRNLTVDQADQAYAPLERRRTA